MIILQPATRGLTEKLWPHVLKMVSCGELHVCLRPLLMRPSTALDDTLPLADETCLTVCRPVLTQTLQQQVDQRRLRVLRIRLQLLQVPVGPVVQILLLLQNTHVA